jgi:hypothetical protein
MKKESAELSKPKGTRGGARPGSGTKPMVPTAAERKLVQTMSGHGVPQEQIAALVRDGIDTDTLYRHFKRELIVGKAEANRKVGATLFQKVLKGDTTSAIFWAKTQMRWREVQAHEITGNFDDLRKLLTGALDEDKQT